MSDTPHSDRFTADLFAPTNTVDEAAERDREVEAADDKMYCPAGGHYVTPTRGTHPEYGPTNVCTECDCWTLYESQTQYHARKLTALGFKVTPKPDHDQ